MVLFEEIAPARRPIRTHATIRTRRTPQTDARAVGTRARMGESVRSRHSSALRTPLYCGHDAKHIRKALALARIKHRRSCLLRVSAELERWREVAATRSLSLTHPHLGWIRYVRDALHMSGYQLAKRVGVRQPTVARLEQ